MQRLSQRLDMLDWRFDSLSARITELEEPLVGHSSTDERGTEEKNEKRVQKASMLMDSDQQKVVKGSHKEYEQARKLDRKNEMNEDSFIDDHGGALSLLYGKETIDGLISAETWFAARHYLAAVCQYSVGELLFGGCKEEVIAEVLQSTCEEEIGFWKTRAGEGKIKMTADLMKETQRRVKDKLKTETLLQFYDEKRKVPLDQLGHSILSRFGSIAFEVDCRLWNPVRQAAVAQELVPAVSVEWELRQEAFKAMDMEIEESMLKGFKDARQILIQELALRKKTRGDVTAALKKVHESCRMKDPMWRMVEDYLNQLGDKHGAAVLEEKFWACFTDPETNLPKTLKQLSTDLPDLKKTALWSWVTEDKQDELGTGIEIIYKMSLGEPPKWHNPTCFRLALMKRLPGLLISYNGKSGAAGLTEMLKVANEKSDATQLTQLHLFRWALGDAQQKELDTLTDRLMGCSSDEEELPAQEEGAEATAVDGEASAVGDTSEKKKKATKTKKEKVEADAPPAKKLKGSYTEGGSSSSSGGTNVEIYDDAVMQKALQYFRQK